MYRSIFFILTTASLFAQSTSGDSIKYFEGLGRDKINNMQIINDAIAAILGKLSSEQQALADDNVDCSSPNLTAYEEDLCQAAATDLELLRQLTEQRDRYRNFMTDMMNIHGKINSGTNAGIGGTDYSSPEETQCWYCNEIPKEKNPFFDSLNTEFVNLAKDASSSILIMAKEEKDINLAKKLLSEAKNYDNILKDYKSGKFFSVISNDNYNLLSQEASKILVAKAKYSASQLAQKDKKYKNLLNVVKKLDPDKIKQNFDSKLAYSALIQINYEKKNKGTNVLLKDQRVDNYYDSTIDLFKIIHKNYYVRRMAGLFKLGSLE